MRKSLSVVIPAYNEAQNLSLTVKQVVGTVHTKVKDYEIIIVNDGSQDSTGEEATQLAGENKHIHVIHNRINRGMGYAILRGIDQAKMNYVTIMPGDNEIDSEILQALIDNVDFLDIIIGYMRYSRKRPLMRRILSKLFVIFMNTLFRLHLRYYTGPFICKTSLVRALHFRSKGHTMIPELYVKLIKFGATYKEIPFSFQRRLFGHSKSLSITEFYRSMKTIYIIARDMYFPKATE